MVDGAFDPLHAGHIDYFKQARQYGPLLCNLAPDTYIRTKHPVLLPAEQRIAVIDALRDISWTHLGDHGTEAVIEQIRPLAYVKGKDWEGRLPERQVALCQRLGIPIVFVETISESSSRLLRAVQGTSAGHPTSASHSGNAHHGS